MQHGLSENNFAFIDGQNLYMGTIKGHNFKIDYTKFRLYLENKYQVTRAYIFLGYLNGMEPLYKFLQETGYIVIHKPTIETEEDGRVVIKGNIDTDLVLHCMLELPNFEKAVIVTSDGDFVCLLDLLTQQRKLKKLLIPNANRYSALLRKYAEHMAMINHIQDKVMLERI